MIEYSLIDMITERLVLKTSSWEDIAEQLEYAHGRPYRLTITFKQTPGIL